MKPGVWLSNNRNYMVVCNGENVSVEGSSPQAEATRAIVVSPTSFYSRAKETDGKDFDPIAYLINRAYMVNLMGRSPEEYSTESVERNREYLKMLEEGKNIPSQEMSQIRKS